MSELIAQKELADRLGLSTRQVRNLEEEGLPCEAKNGRKAFPWPRALHWYIDWKISRATERASTAKDDLYRRKAELEIQVQELEVAKLTGQMVTLDYMDEQVSTILARLRSKLLNMPGKYALQTVGLRTVAESLDRWQCAVNEAMSSLADTGEDEELDGQAPGVAA